MEILSDYEVHIQTPRRDVRRLNPLEAWKYFQTWRKQGITATEAGVLIHLKRGNTFRPVSALNSSFSFLVLIHLKRGNTFRRYPLGSLYLRGFRGDEFNI